MAGCVGTDQRERMRKACFPRRRARETLSSRMSHPLFIDVHKHTAEVFPSARALPPLPPPPPCGVGNRCEPRTSTAAAASQPSPVNVREEQEEKRCKTLKKSKDSERKILERHWYSQIMNENDLLLINTQLHNLTILNSDIFMT